MRTSAIICEYNPFHKGHKIQIDRLKQKGHGIVCIMSGGFVQRGLPSIFNKYKRAETAIKCGADLVLELPYPYCCSPAEFFAFGGVSIANDLGIVDELCFGSECGEIRLLEKTSERLMSDFFADTMLKARQNRINSIKPYAVLREELYKAVYNEDLPVKPNDILGIEYITALKKLESNIIPTTYKRESGYSATEARRLISEENCFDFVPEKIREDLENEDRYYLKNAEKSVLSFYRNADIGSLGKCAEMTDGIAERLVKYSKSATNLSEFIENVSAKSYTNAKINRCIINGMCGVTPDLLKEKPAYTQVLGLNETGRKLLKTAQKNDKIKILTKPSHYKKLENPAFKQACLSNYVDTALTLICDSPKPADYFLKMTPYIQKQTLHEKYV